MVKIFYILKINNLKMIFMLIQIEPPFQRETPPVFILSSKQMLFNTSSENTHRGLLITVRSLTSQSSHMRLFPSIPLVISCVSWHLWKWSYFLLLLCLPLGQDSKPAGIYQLTHVTTGQRNVSLPSPQQVNNMSSCGKLHVTET